MSTASSSNGAYARVGAGPPWMPTVPKKIFSNGIVTLCGIPTVPTVAPGRAILIAVCIEASLPTHSNTASTPTPSSVRAFTFASPVSPRSGITSVAPNSQPRAWRSSCRLIRMILLAPSIFAAITPHNPTAPSPTTATVSPGLTRAITAAW